MPQAPKQGVSKGKNSVGYALSLIGWLVQIVSGIVAILSLSFGPQGFGGMGFMFGGATMHGPYFHGMIIGNQTSLFALSWLSAFWIIIFLFAVVIGGIGVGLLRSTYRDKFFVGALLVLVSAIISYPTILGFGVGSALMIAGGILSFMSGFQFKD